MDGLSSICAGLGTLEEDDNGNRIGYDKGDHCSDNLKDLLRYLRRDDPEKRDVFKQVCKWNIVGKDLIPIIEYYQEERSLTLTAVKILVFLTMPVEPTSTDIPQQIEYLWGLKSAITFSDTVPLIVSVLENPLDNLEKESFTEDDWKLVQLVLTLFRNILAIQDLSTQQKAGRSTSEFLSLRDKFLELLFQENVMDLFTVLSQHTGCPHGYLRQDNLLLLEIYNYILKGQNPELIANINLKVKKMDVAAENSMTSLQSIIEEEQEKRRLTKSNNLSCYSQFSGTYTRVTLDGSKALFKGNPCSASLDVLRSVRKSYRGPSKRTAWDHGGLLPSTKNQILESLHEFICQFLMGGYNVLMLSVREDIDKEHQEIQRSDIVAFFQVAQFVTAFQYHKCLTSKSSNGTDKETSGSTQNDDTLFKGCICRPVSETLNESMFLTVISQCRNSFESLKQTNDHSLLSAAGSLVKTMVQILDLVFKESPEDSDETRTARILLYKLFYDQTEEGMTQFFLNLIKSFDTHKQSKSDLSNLVETMHIVIRLMEKLQARGTIRVSKKGRKKKTKKAMMEEIASESGVNNATIPNEDDSFACEQSLSTNLSEKELTTNQIPNLVKETDNTVKDSFNMYETISKPSNLVSIDSEIEGRVMSDKNDDFDLGTDDSSDDEQLVVREEVDFKVSSLVSALANTTIVRNLCWLLRLYRRNSASTNHSILRILQRICDDLELSPILYQLSLLTIFHEILEEQKIKPCKEYENIVHFLTNLVRRMLRKMKNYPLLAVEVLFWKTRKECHYITCGSMLNEFNHVKNKTFEGRSGISDDSYCFTDDPKWVHRSIADALGDDDFEETFQESKVEDDHMETELPNIECEIFDSREGRPGKEYLCTMPKRRNGFVWDDEMERKLYALYEKFKDSSDCFQLIAEGLDPNGNISISQISKNLKRLGIKFPTRKKIQKSGRPNQQKKSSDSDLQKITSESNLTDLNESSLLRKHTKRVQALSVDQEGKIKEFFAKFKDHKRCSHMIANALDDTGKISAAQVSRKLKKLGLVVSKRKRSNTHFQSKDDDFIDLPSEGADISDDDTLLSLRKRSKHECHGSYDEKHNEKIAPKSSEDMSDNELLSSILVKKKKKFTDGGEELETDSTQKDMIVENNMNFQVTPFSDRVANANDNYNDSDFGKIGMGSASTPDNIDSPQNPTIEDDLEDFEVNVDSIGSQGKSVMRRRARMVIDLEDDD